METPIQPSYQEYWTHAQSKEFSRLNDSVKRVKQLLETTEQVEASKPLTYVKQRAVTSLAHHQRELENLENEFRLKKQLHLDKIKAAEEILNSTAPSIIRLKVELSQAVKKRNEFISFTDSFFASSPPKQVSYLEELPSERLAREEEARRLKDAERAREERRIQEEADRKRHDEQRKKELEEREESENEETFLKELEEAKQRKRQELGLAPKPSIASLPDSPPVPPPKPKKSIKLPSSRKPVKEVGPGVVLYQQPLDE